MPDIESALSVDGAANRILSLIGTEDDADDARPAPTPELEGGEAADEEAPGSSREDTDPEPEDGGEAETPIDPPASWKADAKETFKSLPRDLQQMVADREREREQHFSRTQNEAAQARRAAEAEHQAVREERQENKRLLGDLIDLTRDTDPVLSEGARTDWTAAFRSDPAAAQEKWAAFQGRLQTLGAWKAHRDALAAKAADEELKQSDAKLAVELDFWRDEGKRKAFKSAMGLYLADAGFNASEITGVTDARAILLARKAMLYDQLMAQQARIPAAKKAPPATRTVRVQASVDEGSNAKAQALAKRAAKSGRLDDQAAAVLAALD